MNLTDKEMQVIEAVVNEVGNKQISDKLHLSEKTIKNHLHRIMIKLKLQTRTQVAVWALRNGICK